MVDFTSSSGGTGTPATGVLPASLGIKTAAASVSVAPASDGVFNACLSSPSQAPFGIFAKPNGFGAMQTAGATTKLLNETCDSALDTTNVWALSGTTLPAVSGGKAVLSLTAANSVSSVMSSLVNFVPTTQPYELALQLDLGTTSAQVNPNVHSFAGKGKATAYAAATPVTDGFGFERDLTGALNAVIYKSGTRYVVNSTNPALITAPGSWDADMVLSTYGQTMTWPTTGTFIGSVQYFNGYVLFYAANSVTGLDVPIGFAFYTPADVQLPIRIASISTPAVSTVLATTFTLKSGVLAIINGTNNTVSDPIFGWRQQSVDAQSRAYSVAPDIFVTGVAAQTASGNNLLLAAAGTTSIDTQSTGTRSIAIQIIPTGTVTSGVVTFEGSQDNVTFNPLLLYDDASATANPVSTVSPATGVSRFFVGNTKYRYVRARISTVIGGGGSLQALYTLNQSNYQSNIQTVTQATAANFNTTDTISNGQTAHSAAATGNPVRVGLRVGPAAVDTSLAAGEATDWNADFNGAATVKPYAISTFDWNYAAPPAGLSNSTTPVTIKGAPSAGTRNYITSLLLSSDALGAATEFAIRDVSVAANSQTIASNILTTATNHGWTVGDAVIPSASGVTGLTAGVQVYVLTVPSATTATFSATPGGSTLAISGTGVTATLNHYLWRCKLSTAGVIAPAPIVFPTPLKGGVALAQEMLTLTASITGAVFANLFGYQGI